MRIIINEKETVFPSALSEINVGQMIDWQDGHGVELDRMAKVISEMPAGIHKDASASEFQQQKMMRNLSFYSGFSIESLEEIGVSDRVASDFYSLQQTLAEEQNNLQLQPPFFFQDQVWTIRDPEHVRVLEVARGNKLLLHLIGFTKGGWKNLLLLCCHLLENKSDNYGSHFYDQFLFRGVGQTEFFTELSDEGMKRIELMQKLPLDIALQVALFLKELLHLSLENMDPGKPINP